MTNEQKVGVYGLFKQAKEGDNTVDSPVMVSAARPLWDAWEARKGMSQKDA